MANVADILTNNLGIWTSAIERRSSAGRGRSKKFSLYGIEKLRALILDLAVRGKLVPQYESDEPATELLKQVKRTKKELITTGKIGKGHDFDRQSVKAPFDLPSNWAWIQLSDIGHDWGQKTPDSDFTYIDVGSIDQNLGRVAEPSILTVDAAPSRARKCVREGTVIYSTVRPYLLNIAIIDRIFDPEPIASTAFAVIHPFAGIMSSFVYRYLRSPAFIAYVEACQTGIAYPAINDKQFFSAPFPLPPLAEQQRIVAKVDELMALCDALEAETYQAIEAHELLVANLLATLTRSADAEELAGNWALVEAHFDTLFTTEASIDQLKQTILQLAVMGKLVPQDLNDEPASELLKRISKEVAAYSKLERIRPPQPEPIEAGMWPYKLPQNWRWARLCSLFKVITDGDHQPPPKADRGVAFLTIGNVTTGTLDFEDCRLVPEAYFQSLAPYRTPAKGDVLYTVVGATYGRPAIVDTDREFCVQRHIAILKPVSNMDLRFTSWLLSSPLVYEQASKSTTGTAQPTIALRPLRNFLVPLPPIKEQQRIAEKVAQLFGICEVLKARLAESQRQQVQFADAVASKAVA